MALFAAPFHLQSEAQHSVVKAMLMHSRSKGVQAQGAAFFAQCAKNARLHRRLLSPADNVTLALIQALVNFTDASEVFDPVVDTLGRIIASAAEASVKDLVSKGVPEAILLVLPLCKPGTDRFKLCEILDKMCARSCFAAKHCFDLDAISMLASVTEDDPACTCLVLRIIVRLVRLSEGLTEKDLRSLPDFFKSEHVLAAAESGLELCAFLREHGLEGEWCTEYARRVVESEVCVAAHKSAKAFMRQPKCRNRRHKGTKRAFNDEGHQKTQCNGASKCLAA